METRKLLESLMLHLDEAEAIYRELIRNASNENDKRDWRVDQDSIKGARTFCNSRLHDAMRSA